MARREPEESSVLTRTLDGRITGWSPRAEQLYGWEEAEAVGKLSHDLLQTQFPEQLEEIESELLEKGKWQGKLVHATRDGDHVVVESRWILKDTGGTQAVVEINGPSAMNEAEANPSSAMGVTTAETKNEQASAADGEFRSARILRKLSLWLFACLAAGWMIYAAAGHDIIRWLFTSPSLGVLDGWFQGRGVVPLGNYYREADALLVYTTLRLLAVYALLLLLIRAPAGLVLLGVSSLVTSLLLFSFFEIAPSLIRPLRLELISPYHAYKASYLYDEELAYREKPFNYIRVEEYKGSHYSALFHMDVSPRIVDWRMDEQGFRNAAATGSAQIVAVGDSFLEFGDNTADTFVARLERRLDGLKVANLGKSGYGPPQYVEVLKRYGLSYKPKYALFGFYEGNDVSNIHDYFLWKTGERDNPYTFLKFSQTSFLRRYLAAMATAVTSIRSLLILPIEFGLHSVARTGGYAPPIHPKLAQLDLGGGAYERMLFVDRLDTTNSNEEMLKKNEWRTLEKILVEFKAVCAEHGILPILVYIPAAAHIYAEYSTEASGAQWLNVRKGQIAAKKNTAAAVARLAQDVGIDLIDLGPTFEEVAGEQLLYHRLDSHWTAHGREVAAEFVAGQMRARYLSASAQ